MKSEIDLKYITPFIILAVFFLWEAAMFNAAHLAPAQPSAALSYSVTAPSN
jgi:hypothetical protein